MRNDRISRLARFNGEKRMNRFLLLVAFVLVIAPLGVPAAEPVGSQPEEGEYFRLAKKQGKRADIPVALDTAIVRFEGEPADDGKPPLRVDLVAAIHVGDKEYYEELNERFKQYETVLYEMVMPEGTTVDAKTFSRDKREERGNVLSAFQDGMSKMLQLEHQLDHIDYTASNFVHADLSAEEFLGRISDRGDLFATVFRTFLLGLSNQNEKDSAKFEGRMLATIFVKNKALALKRAFSEEMVGRLKDSVWVFSGDEGSALITDRNAIALERLREQIRAGKRNIAIFYGGAHLPEFAESLQNEFHLQPTETTWVLAWDMTADRSGRPKCER